MTEKRALQRELGTWHVAVSGIAVIVASSTLVSDFVGWLSLGLGFAFALLIAFAANFFLGLSIAELSTRFPRAGAVYAFAREGLSGRNGATIGVFLALLFYLTVTVGAASEVTSGAHGLVSLLGDSVDLRVGIAILLVAALIPNLIGLQSVAWVNAILLLGMLGIRWWVGIASFFGWTEPGTWEAGNIATELSLGTILGSGLGLAIWTFIGIESVASLAEEVKEPRKAMPRGIIITLLVVLATTVIMGIGTAGVLSPEAWKAIALGEAGCDGNCAQLAVGQTLFGSSGELMMAIASVTASYGSVSVVLAGMSRIIYSLARDKHLGGASSAVGSLNRFSAPWVALLVTASLLLAQALWSAHVLDLLYTASYTWLLLFAAYHIIAIVVHRKGPASPEVFKVPGWLPWVGLALVLLSVYYAFIDLGHLKYGGRALAAIGIITVISFLIRPSKRE